MTLDELKHALDEALASGNVGTSVSLRLHAQLAGDDHDEFTLLDKLVALAEPVFSARPARLLARSNNDARQMNLLFEYAAGQTLLVTIGRASSVRATLDVVLVGNHGIVRLEGGESFDTTGLSGDSTADRSKLWRDRVEKSVASAAPVTLPSS